MEIPLRKALRWGCGGLLLVFCGVNVFFMALIGYRDHERERWCSEALAAQVRDGITVTAFDKGEAGNLAVTEQDLATDEFFTNWSDVATEVRQHLRAGGQVRRAWGQSDTEGFLYFDRSGRAVRYTCTVT